MHFELPDLETERVRHNPKMHGITPPSRNAPEGEANSPTRCVTGLRKQIRFLRQGIVAGTSSGSGLLRELQRTFGNRYVQRLVSLSRDDDYGSNARPSAPERNAVADTAGRNIDSGIHPYGSAGDDRTRLLDNERVPALQRTNTGPAYASSLRGAADIPLERDARQAADQLQADSTQLFNGWHVPMLQRQDDPSLGQSDFSSDTMPPTIPDNGPVTPLDTGPSTPANSQPGACVVKEEIPANVSAITNRNGQVRQTFEMNIDWQNSPSRVGSYCDCACGEYRQYVKGHLILDGQPQTVKLWGGAALEESVYHEDGLESDSSARYGHRDEPQKMSEQFTPDRATGCSYRGTDAPGVFLGQDVDVLFHFKGQTYDRCNQMFGEIHEWEFRFKGKLNYGP